MTFYEELLENTNMSQREVQDFLLYGAFLRCTDWNRRFSQALDDLAAQFDQVVEPVTLTDDKIEQLAVDSEIVFRCGKKLLTPFLEHIDLRRNVHTFANAIIAALREKEKQNG